MVIPFLIFINYTTYWGHKWFWYPMFGWGIGLVIQGVRLLGFNRGWEQRKVKEFMDSDQF